MDFALDSNGDLDIKNGDFYFVEGHDAIDQFLRQRLKLFLAEWFLDETKGVAYYDEVYVKNPNPVVVSSIFKTVILETPGVLELMEFSLEVDSDIRRLRVKFKARTAFGTINFDEVL